MRPDKPKTARSAQTAQADKSRSPGENATPKRVILGLLLIIVLSSYVVLTGSRYSGQGLTPIYLRFSTVSDCLSLFTLILLSLPVIRAIWRPERISLGRAILAAAVSLILLWIELGLKRFDASDFSPFSSVALIWGIFLQFGLISTSSIKAPSLFGRIWRVLRSAALISLFYIAFGFIFSFGYPSVSDLGELTHFGADAGVVFGAAVWSGNKLGSRPSPTLRERINIGYDLLTSKAITRLVVTGANAPGEEAEALVARQEFVKLGIDPSAIIVEKGSHSTIDQIRYIRDELQAKQGWTKFIAISDQYHLARILEMCKFNGVRAIGTPSKIRQPLLDLAFYRFRESFALLAFWLLGK